MNSPISLNESRRRRLPIRSCIVMFFIADSAAVFLLRSRGESRGSEVVLGFLDTVFPFLKYI